MTSTQVQSASMEKAIKQVQDFGEALKSFVRKTYDDETLRRMSHTSWGRKNLRVSQSETDTDTH